MSQTIVIRGNGFGARALTLAVEVIGRRTRSAVEHVGDIAAYVADIGRARVRLECS